MGEHMANDIKEKVESLDAVENTTVTVTFDPAWKPEMMTDDAKKSVLPNHISGAVQKCLHVQGLRSWPWSNKQQVSEDASHDDIVDAIIAQCLW